MDKQEVLRIMRTGSRKEKMDYLNFLDNVFDTYNRSIVNASAVVQELINCALASNDDGLTDEIIEVICSAQISQDLHDIDYSAIANSLTRVPEKFLPRYIDMLGNTGDVKFLSDIMKFKSHKSKSVQDAVNDALIELRVSDRS